MPQSCYLQIILKLIRSDNTFCIISENWGFGCGKIPEELITPGNLLNLEERNKQV